MAHLSEGPVNPAPGADRATVQPEAAQNQNDLKAMRPGPQPLPQPRKGFTMARLAWTLTAIWVVAVGSYILSFVSWSEGKIMDNFSQMPLPDLLLFVIFCLVPLTMIWAVSATSKSVRGSPEEIKAQTESAQQIASDLEALHKVATEQRRLLIKAFDTTAQELEERLEVMSGELLGTVNQVTDEARTTLSRRGELMDHAFVRIENRLDSGMAERFSEIERRLGDTGKRLDAKIEEQSKEMRDILADRVATFDDMLAESQGKLESMVAARLEEKATGAIEALSQQLNDVRNALASQEKPADTPDPGRTKELERLSDAVSKLCKRLDEMDAPRASVNGQDTQPPQRQKPELDDPTMIDLSDLDATEGDALEWSRLLGAMGLGTGSEAQPVAASDPILRRLVPLGRRLQSRLAEDGLYVQDLTPDQAAPEHWQSYAQGERNALLARDLSGISDPVAVALVRASVKGDAAFRLTSEAYVRVYQKLLDRTVAQDRNGADLIALSETTGGRLFSLVGNVNGAFDA
ncbi:MAG: hypothetical protein AAGC79_05500 [Pseudomonadota bacterium]